MKIFRKEAKKAHIVMWVVYMAILSYFLYYTLTHC